MCSDYYKFILYDSGNLGMRLIIAGTRTFDCPHLMERMVNQYLNITPHLDVTIISGGARGADTLGEQYAKRTWI